MDLLTDQIILEKIYGSQRLALGDKDTESRMREITDVSVAMLAERNCCSR